MASVSSGPILYDEIGYLPYDPLLGHDVGQANR